MLLFVGLWMLVLPWWLARMTLSLMLEVRRYATMGGSGNTLAESVCLANICWYARRSTFAIPVNLWWYVMINGVRSVVVVGGLGARRSSRLMSLTSSCDFRSRLFLYPRLIKKLTNWFEWWS